MSVPQVSVQTALLDNYVASDLLPSIKRWQILMDENDHPMMIYLTRGDEPSLRIIKRDAAHGQTSLQISLDHFRQMSHTVLPSGSRNWPLSKPWEDFVVSQNPVTKKIALVIQGEAPDNFGTSNFHQIGPFSPNDLTLDGVKNIANNPVDMIRLSGLDYWVWQRHGTSWKAHLLHVERPSSNNNDFPCIAARFTNQPQGEPFEWDLVTMSNHAFPGVRLPSWTRPFILKDDDSAPNLTVNGGLKVKKLLDVKCGRWKDNIGSFYLFTTPDSYSDLMGRSTIESNVHLYFVPNQPFTDPTAKPVSIAADSLVRCYLNDTDEAVLMLLHSNTRNSDEPLILMRNQYIRLRMGPFPPPSANGESILAWVDSSKGTDGELTYLGQLPETRCDSAQISQHGDDVRFWVKGASTPSIWYTTRFAYASVTSGTELKESDYTPFVTLKDNEDLQVMSSASSVASIFDHHVLIAAHNVAEKTTSYRSASQSGSTGLWTTSEAFFTVPDVKTTVKFSSHTTHFVISDGFNVFPDDVLIGPNVNYDFDLDKGRNLTVAEETADLSGAKLTLSLRQGSPYPVLASSDPNEKMVEKMGNMSDADLRQLGVSDQNLTATKEAMTKLAKKHKNLNSHPVMAPMGLTDTLDSAWHFLCDETTKFEAKIEGAVDGVMTLAYKIGQKLLNIVINTIEDISRAAHAILNALGVAWHKIKDFFGAVFNFAEIGRQAAAIEASGNQILLLMRAAIDATIDGAENWIAEKVKDLDSKIDNLLPFDQLAQNGIGDLNEQSEGGDPSKQWISSPKISIITGSINAKGVQPQTSQTNGKSPDLDSIQSKVQAMSLPDGWSDKMKTLSEHLKELFKKGITVQGVVTIIKDFAKLFLAGIQALIKGLLEILRLLLDTIIDTLLSGIEIPILSSLIRLCFSNDDGKIHPLRIVSFVLATCMVEMEVFGLLPALKDHAPGTDFGLAYFNSQTASVPAAIKKYFAGTPTAHTMIKPLAFADAGDTSFYSTYPGICSFMHPVILAAGGVFAVINNANKYTMEAVPLLKIFDVADFVRTLLEIGFSTPTGSDRGALGIRLTGWILNAISSVVSALPLLTESAGKIGEKLNLFKVPGVTSMFVYVTQVVGGIIYIAGISFTARALDQWRNNLDGETWSYDKDALEKTIGNTTVGAVGSVTRVFESISSQQAKDNAATATPVGALAAAAWGAIAFGLSIVDTVCVVADCGVDVKKAVIEGKAWESEEQKTVGQPGHYATGGYLPCLHC